MDELTRIAPELITQTGIMLQIVGLGLQLENILRRLTISFAISRASITASSPSRCSTGCSTSW